MEDEEEKGRIVQFRNQVGEMASEFGGKVGETAKLTYDHLNFLKHFTDLDKEISKNEKEKAISIIEGIKDIKDDDTKAEILKDYFDANNKKEVTEKIIYAAKYLSGTAAVIVVAALVSKK